MKFFTIASGSSGNAYYLGIGGRNFLVDAGVSGKRIEHALWKYEIRDIDGIFVTHEHRDHITGAGVVARKMKTKIFAAPLTWRYFLRHKILGPLDEWQAETILPDAPLDLGGAEVTAFDIPHDATQPVGFVFKENGYKAVFATDLGHAPDTLKARLKGAKILLLESNHDPEMLQNGRYHRDLKIRVASDRGHLSNSQAGRLIAEVAERGTHVVLAHLSEENNTPMLAFDTVSRILDGNSVAVASLSVAERNVVGEMVRFE